MTDSETDVQDATNRAISIAQLKYGGNDGMFNTAGFQTAVRELRGWTITTDQAAWMLAQNSNVRKLGNAYWRYVAPLERESK